MSNYRYYHFPFLALVAVLTSASLGSGESQAGNKTAPIQIGLAKTFLLDQPKGVADVAADDFKNVLKKTTSLAGDLNSKLGAIDIADLLQSKKLDFGIFHGHEFAWANKKHPELKPLLVAINKQYAEQAFVIVYKNNAAKTIADLRGKKLDMPLGTKEPTRLFLDKLCRDAQAKSAATFFGAIEKSTGMIAALDGVAREKIDAAVIDSVNLAHYKDVRGPVFEKNLRVLTQSDPFPHTVVAYLPGKLDETTVAQFRAGLLKAHTINEGKELMHTWRIDAFEAAPGDYAKSLESVLKTYPGPN